MKDKQSKYRFYGKMLFYILKLISITLRVKIITKSNMDLKNLEDNYVFGFWHNKLVVSLLCLPTKKGAVLASPSKDGELVATPLEMQGFKVLRGSSNKESVKSLLSLIAHVKGGYNVGTPLDGPKGPRYKAKGGLLYISKKSKKKLLLVGGGYSRVWEFKKSWDKFLLPKPFSKVICLVDEPFEIPKDADVELYSKIVEERLVALDNEASKLLKK